MGTEALYNQPVVVDNGSGNLKAGFAGEDKPRVFISSIVGRPRYQKIMAGSLTAANEDIFRGDNAYIGDIVQKHRGILKLSYPLEHGVVTNWDDMERVWAHLYRQELQTRAEEHPLLITEAPLNPRTNREKMCQVLFELFNVPCMYIAIQAVLSLYASGRTTGVVIDIGDGVSHIVPVYEGFALPTSIKRMNIAGRNITELLSHQLTRMNGIYLRSGAEMEIVRLIKEKCCFVSKNPSSDESLYSSSAYSYYLSKSKENMNSDLFTTYKLPDGHILRLGAERFRAPEILFNPEIIGEESPGIDELVALAISKTDLELRPTLYQNLVLSGGTTLTKNFGDRLLSELKARQNEQMKSTSIWTNSTPYKDYDTNMKIKIQAPAERRYTTWIGGSILAGLSTFKKMWITSQEYSENPDIIHKKFL